ncbi:MAG: two-component system, OmpR family, sensor kinase, partial [Solirubrobacterales bacterium]|nr:two-component system, OmpR family, sensor kinase [Solirubrobacterales bacterium]
MGDLDTGIFFAIVPAAVLLRDRVRSRRRRYELNRSLHELRRPLQALALSNKRDYAAADGFLDLAMSALGDLDRAVNGQASNGVGRREVVSSHELAVAAAGRWRSSHPGIELQLYWDAGPAAIVAIPEQIGQAFDNLIANALEHGSPPLSLTACTISGRVRITISDRGPGAGLSGSNGNGSAPERRGHGLALVSEIAAAHGGRFAISRSQNGTVAALELPLAG